MVYDDVMLSSSRLKRLMLKRYDYREMLKVRVRLWTAEKVHVLIQRVSTLYQCGLIGHSQDALVVE